MPTQEEINAANVELQIAQDNYATLADRYNKYMNVFEMYSNAAPETQQRASNTMKEAMADFEKLKLNMYAAEDRIAQAQNRVNNYNNLVVNQPVARQRRRTTTPNNYFWWTWWTNNNGTLTSWNWWTTIYPNWSISFQEPTPVVSSYWWTTSYRPSQYEIDTIPWAKEYNAYANAYATGWTKWITSYLRTLPNPVTHPRYTNSLYNDMIKNWISHEQADDFVRNWTRAHTP